MYVRCLLRELGKAAARGARDGGAAEGAVAGACLGTILSGTVRWWATAPSGGGSGGWCRGGRRPMVRVMVWARVGLPRGKGPLAAVCGGGPREPVDSERENVRVCIESVFQGPFVALCGLLVALCVRPSCGLRGLRVGVPLSPCLGRAPT